MPNPDHVEFAAIAVELITEHGESITYRQVQVDDGANTYSPVDGTPNDVATVGAFLPATQPQIESLDGNDPELTVEALWIPAIGIPVSVRDTVIRGSETYRVLKVLERYQPSDTEIASQLLVSK